MALLSQEPENRSFCLWPKPRASNSTSAKRSHWLRVILFGSRKTFAVAGNASPTTSFVIDQAGIHLEDGRLIKAAEVLHLDQGIALTSHASQGMTGSLSVSGISVQPGEPGAVLRLDVASSGRDASLHRFKGCLERGSDATKPTAFTRGTDRRNQKAVRRPMR